MIHLRDDQKELDSFAKAIATGLFANHGWMQNFKAQYYGDDIDRAMASIVYDLAEAMMTEREKRMR